MVVEVDRTGRGTAAGYDGSAQRWVDVADTPGVTRQAAARMLSGDDLIAAGMTPGPAFRSAVDASVQAQDDGVFADVAGARGWFARTYLG